MIRLSLPQNYVAQNWRLTWVGFDVLLLAFLITTAVLGFLPNRLLTLFAFTTGVLLICDAWFDLMTARPRRRCPVGSRPAERDTPSAAPVGGVDFLPTSRCVESERAGASGKAQYTCYAPVDAFTIEVHAADATGARQQTAAQYKMLLTK